MTSSKWDVETVVGVSFTVLAACIGIWMIASAYNSSQKQEKFDRACLIAGGVPLYEQCVRPGAFMEVNP